MVNPVAQPATPYSVIAIPVDAELAARLMRDFGVVPLRREGAVLVVLASEPERADLAAELAFALGCEVRVVGGDPAETRELIRRNYGEPGRRPGDAVQDTALPPLAELAAEPPVVQLVSRILGRAVGEQASDVHFEPFEHEFRIRCRVDGALRVVETPPRNLALPVTSRLKVLANLDIAERRIPQDGRIRFAHAGREVDLRISTLPTQFGESVVLRVLDQAAVRLELGELGLPAGILSGLRDVIQRPTGMLLVTGPTGSGKTTTLYSALRAINSPEHKLLTIEDPVEYEVDGARQVSVNAPAGLGFAAALRSFLRHDPDVIMVGEIRDLETARICVQAALTGHLVLSTMHTNDAPSAAARLVDLGVEPFLLASTVEAILAQRLVRTCCPACREDYEPEDAVRRKFGLVGAAGGRFRRGRGCQACGGTGYRGRMGIFEWLVMDEALRDLVTRQAPAQAIGELATARGMRTLRQEGLRAVEAGLTTLEELARYL